MLQQGNRSSSSACGSADVLEALGVVIDLGPEVSAGYQLPIWDSFGTIVLGCSFRAFTLIIYVDLKWVFVTIDLF